MPKPKVVIDYTKCSPDTCSPNEGHCAAVDACPHDILMQEAPHEAPMVMFWDLCQSCGDCVDACVCDAISLD